MVADVQRIGYFLLKGVTEAVREFGMIRRNDRIAVAVSGGKDSLALLSLLARLQQVGGVAFELAAVHVRGDATGVLAEHGPLAAWLAEQHLPWRIVTPEIGLDEELPMGCQRCTWLRRKALFTAAAELGCNTVAYAHHADDAAQTTLLNLLYGGHARGLAPAAEYFGGRFRLIRPLLYVPERSLARYAGAAGFPPPPPACPRSGSSRRATAAQMLKLLGRDYPDRARTNLLRAGLRPVTAAAHGRPDVDTPAWEEG